MAITIPYIAKASPRAVMIMAVVLISGRSAVPAKPAEPALPIAIPAARAERPKAMAADKYFVDVASTGDTCIA